MDPSQCSMSTPEAMPVLSVVDPDAQQSVAVTQVRPLRYPPSGVVTGARDDYQSYRPSVRSALGRRPHLGR